MEEESRLIKLMANFPACDLREAYFKRWKEIFSEAIESEQELNALRAWKAKARPFLEEAVRTIHEYYHPAINPPIDDSIWEEEKKDLEILTELLGGSDE